jgi:hypothetical protein
VRRLTDDDAGIVAAGVRFSPYHVSAEIGHPQSLSALAADGVAAPYAY